MTAPDRFPAATAARSAPVPTDPVTARACSCGGTAHRSVVEVKGKPHWMWSCDSCTNTQYQPRPPLDEARAALAAVPDRIKSATKRGT